MYLAACRPSTVGQTTVWASGSMALLPNDAGEVPHEEETARGPEVQCYRVLRSLRGAVIPTTSTVVEGVTGSTLVARFGCALRAVVLVCGAVHE